MGQIKSALPIDNPPKTVGPQRITPMAKRWKIGKLNIENEQYRKMCNCEYSNRNLALHTQSEM